MNHPIRVMIVDDNDLFRQATCTWLESADGITIVGEAKDGPETIGLIRELEPDVVLWGLGTLHPDALQTVARISELCPHSKIIVLSVYDGQERLVLEAFRKGALGYLAKEKSQPPQIIEAIRTVSRGGAILRPCVAGWIVDEISQKRPHKVENRENGP